MRRRVQVGSADFARARRAAVAAACIGLALLAGCSARGLGLDAIAADRSIVTGSTSAPKPDPHTLSDETTVRNAISAADLESLGVGQALAWSNAQTGSRGRIMDVTETRQNGRPCRSFRTTREAFDGVAIYSGEACLRPDNQWSMLSFRRM